jgi:DNA-binding XRE family transcriptional regulator
MSNEFAEARKRLQDLDRKESEIDWDNPEEVSEYRRERRLQKKLEFIPPDFKCPRCHKVKRDPSQWVLNPRVQCRSCRFRKLSNPPSRMAYMDPILGPPEIRYSLNTTRLIEARYKSGLSQREFARRAGWSRARQRALEFDVVSITQDVAETILQVLMEAGVETEDQLIDGH